MTIMYLQIALLKQQICNIILQISLNDVQARLITSTGVLAFRKCIMIRKGAFCFVGSCQLTTRGRIVTTASRGVFAFMLQRVAV